MDTFVNQNNNKALDYDGQYGAQCVDLIQFWAKALGKRPFSGNAINIPSQNHDQWTWVPNTPSAVPTPGSIMCFAANVNATTVHTGPFGHVDLFISGDVNSWLGFDQNWNNVQRCLEIHHGNYAGVMGWLAPIVSPAPVGGTASVLRACNVRTAPSTSATVTSVLQPGNTFSYQNKVTGDNVGGNNVWYHSTLGHFVWSGNCEG